MLYVLMRCDDDITEADFVVNNNIFAPGFKFQAEFFSFSSKTIGGHNPILSIKSDPEKSGNADSKGIYAFGRWIEKMPPLRNVNLKLTASDNPILTPSN